MATNEFASYAETDTEGLEAYQEDTSNIRMSEDSQKSVDAQVAILDDSRDTVDRYQELQASYPAVRNIESTMIVEQAKQKEKSQRVDAVTNALVAGDIGQDQAPSLFIEMANNDVDKKNSLELVADKMAMAPAVEPHDSELRREQSMSWMDEFVAHKQFIQTIATGELLSTDTSTAAAVGDFLQYFVPLDESMFVAQVVDEIKGGDLSSVAEAFALLGSSKASLRDYYQNELDFGQKREFLTSIAAIANDSRGLIFTNDNDLVQRDFFLSIADASEYDDVDVVIDNVFSMLDLIGVGALFKPIKLARAASRVAKSTFRSKVQPASVGRVTQGTNPDEAVALHAAATLDESGETAQAVYGTTKEEAILDAGLPQVKKDDDSIDDLPVGLNEDVDRMTQSGRINLSESEQIAARDADLKRVNEGVTGSGKMTLDTTRQAAPKVREDGGQTWKSVYSNNGRGWTDPMLALETAKLTTRQFNVDPSQITILQKTKDGYVPTTVEELEAKKALREAAVKSRKKLPEELKKINMQDDYLVQVQFDRDFELGTSPTLDKLQVKRNWFDRVPFFNQLRKGASSLNRNLFDAASMFDPRITLGSNVAVDKGIALEQAIINNVGKKFTEPYKGFSEESKQRVMKVIKDENYNERQSTLGELKAAGLEQPEIDAIKAWRETWDNAYWLENRVLVKNLKSYGYQMYQDRANKTDLIVKPMGKGTTGIDKAYDPRAGKYDYDLNPQRMEEIYEGGGTIAKLRNPEMIDGRKVEYIIVENKIDKPYIRDLKESDMLLNYKQGYYTVRYKDPHIIEEIELDADGVPTGVTRAVATAPDVKEADTFVKNKNASLNPDKNVEYRARTNRDNASDQFGDYWDIQRSNGRINQRVRGERLKGVEVTTNSTIENAMGSLQDPVEALTASIRGLSQKVSMTEHLNTLRTRIITQYGKYLPKDNAGKPTLPDETNPINWGAMGRESSKEAADLRSYLEYYNYLSFGYRNSIDDGFKAIINSMAEITGKASPKAEKAIRAVGEEVESPSGFARGRAFEAYLALNPLRQAIVQSHQATLLTANFFKYVTKQKLAKDVAAIHLVMLMGDKIGEAKNLKKLTGMSADEAKKLHKDYMETGLEAGISRNNLIEEGLDGFHGTGRFKTAKAVKKAVVDNSRKVGFDAGERMNIMSSWLAHRNRALEKAKAEGRTSLTLREKDQVLGEARNYTFNMNSAGDMPYNKNSLSLIFQFMQVPHKAMLQLTNRALSREERLKLLAYNIVVMPLPVGFVVGLIGEENLPQDPDARDALINGLEGYALNKLAEVTLGAEGKLDFTSLSATDPTALYDLIEGMLTGNIAEILSGSPSLSLVAGNNPRVGAMVQELGTFFSEPTGENLQVAVESFASYSSGYRNASQTYKELVVQNYMKRYSSSGAVIDPELSAYEAAGKAFGFDSVDSMMSRTVNTAVYEASKAASDDVKGFYREFKQALTRRGITADQGLDYNKEVNARLISSTAFLGFTDGQKKQFMNLVVRDMQKGDSALAQNILRTINYANPDEVEGLVNLANIPEVTDFYEGMKAIKGFGEE